MTQRTPRRDFLFGNTAAVDKSEADEQAARESTGAAADGSRSLNKPYLVHLSRKAMAGEFEICLPVSIAGEATAAALEALDHVQSLERQLSYFRPDSDISEINREAADAAVEVEPRLFALLQTSMQLWRESGGAYDITATPLWEAWGFARRAGTIPSPEQLAEAQALVGGQWVELDDAQKTIRLLRRGVRLNLGSIGKGYAVDRAVEHLLAAGLSDFLVHGGYSSVAARGTPIGPTKIDSRSDRADAGTVQPPWTIGVKDPLQDERRLGQIELQDRALGTSGAQFQSFRHRGQRYGHILDPRTGRPADGVLSVTVLAPTAAEADGLSTAFYVMGPETAMSFCRQRPSIAALVFASVTGNRWELHHHGLGKESADLLTTVTKQ
jgi:FAD:protein FMN transferase